MKKAMSIRVHGKVQNVGFRYYTVKTAAQFMIHGFVQNEPDGTVYIEAEGEAADIDTFTDWCRRGPDWARVESLDIQEIPVSGHRSFLIK
jgi:acylphosphatase